MTRIPALAPVLGVFSRCSRILLTRMTRITVLALVLGLISLTENRYMPRRTDRMSGRREPSGTSQVAREPPERRGPRHLRSLFLFFNLLRRSSRFLFFDRSLSRSLSLSNGGSKGVLREREREGF